MEFNVSSLSGDSSISEPDEEVVIMSAHLGTRGWQLFSNCNMENPYLAHLFNSKKGGTSKDGVSGAVNPLRGWTPRKITAEHVRTAMNSDVNPFTKLPVSTTYKRIMESRKKLPVYGFMQTFYGIVGASKFGCLEGP